jgi:DNA-binding NarL/FixJ family response regulator
MAASNKMFNLKIVTVDDSLIIADRLQSILNQIENVDFKGNATNMNEALRLIDKIKPHIVILDIQLNKETPKENGIALLKSLRKKFSEMKIIMLTNLTDRHYRESCYLLGADYFLDKSNEFEKITEIIGILNQQAK